MDACTIIEAELGRRDVPVAGETEFPGGVQVTISCLTTDDSFDQLGFYYNYCGGRVWRDSGERSRGRVCCRVQRTH